MDASSTSHFKDRKAEREAVAFVDQLIKDVGGLKKHLRNLQDKCEVNATRQSPRLFPSTECGHSLSPRLQKA